MSWIKYLLILGPVTGSMIILRVFLLLGIGADKTGIELENKIMQDIKTAITKRILIPICKRAEDGRLKKDIAVLLVIVGIWLRGRGLAAPLWYDEAFSINMARLPLINMARATMLDYTPGFYYLLIKPFSWINNAPWLVRIPSLLASIMSLAIVWEMIEDWEITNNQRLWISALTMLPGFFWLAQDARVYSILGLLYLLSFWLLMGGQYIWATITMILLSWAHPTGLILTLSIMFVNLIRDWLLLGILGIRKIFKAVSMQTVLSCLVGSSVGLIAQAPILFGQEAVNYISIPLSWQQIYHSIMTAMFVETLKGPAMMAAYVVVGLYLLIALMISGLAIYDWIQLIKEKDTTGKIPDDVVVTSGLMVIVPFVLLIIVSVATTPIINYRQLMPLLYPLIIWVGSATAMQEYKPYKLIMPAALGIILAISLIGWNPRQKGSSIIEAATMINRDPGPILYATGTAALPFDLYIDQPGWIAEAEQYPTMLGQYDIMKMFGWEYRTPDSWAKWIIWPRDPLITAELAADLESITAQEYQLVGIVEYWQIGDVEIWENQP